jgi:hypothetical protein
VAAGDLASRLGGPEAVAVINPGLSGRPRFISKAFLDSGGQEIFQNSPRHGCQYVFIVIDGMRSELRGKLTLKARTSIRARTAAGEAAKDVCRLSRGKRILTHSILRGSEDRPGREATRGPAQLRAF